jgi:hypothetical protein
MLIQQAELVRMAASIPSMQKKKKQHRLAGQEECLLTS